MNRIESWDEFFMRHVYLIAEKSRDPRTHIGAVLVRDKNIVSGGFNGFPVGVKDLEERYLDRDLKLRMVAHAEFNSVIQAAKLGISTKDTILYTQGLVCSECCKAVINGGIRQIVTHKQWKNLTYSPKWVESFELSKLMLDEAGVEVMVFDKTLGITGFLDGQIINV